MSETYPPHAQPPPTGCFSRLVAFISTFYLISMAAYLVLRLALGGGTWWLALLNSYAVYTFLPAFILLGLSLLTNHWRNVVRLGLVCLLAVVWFGPFFQPKQTPIPRGDSLIVVTLNLYGGDDDISAQVTDWLGTDIPDILLIQQAPPDFMDQLGTVLDALPEQVAHADDRLTLTRFTVLDFDADRVIIDVDGQEVAIFNVYMPRPTLPDARFSALANIPALNVLTRYDEAARNEQISALLDVLRTEERPYIVGGGFNMSQHAIVYSQVRLVMRDSFRDASIGLGATWPSHLPLLRLDYVWHSRDFTAISATVGEDVGSDHRPVSAHLDLR